MGTWGNFEEIIGGVGKSGGLEHNAAISLKRVKIEEKLPWRAYRNSPTLFRTVPSPTLYGLSSTRLGVRNPTQNCNGYYFSLTGTLLVMMYIQTFTISIGL